MKTIMRWTVLLLTASVVIACAGRRATLVPEVQANDPYLPCEYIYQEMKSNETEILNRVPKTDKKAENITYGIGGIFMLAPWLFVDLSQAERKEIQAYQRRNAHLRAMAKQKHCPMVNLPNPSPVPEPEKLFE